MEEPAFEVDFLGASRVAIWGLGLMGGSLAMALQNACAELVGIDADPKTVERALELGIVSRADTHPGKILQGADLVVLAVPVCAILATLAHLPDLCPGPVVVLDLGSTKHEIVEAMVQLPEHFDPVGGHPMCGKEKSSLEYAEAGLFQGATFALTALERTSKRARSVVEQLVRVVGARSLWIAADIHDRIVAATSHAPYLVASALAQATPREAAPLVGPGFRSAARLAGSSTAMMIDILQTNSANIRSAIRQFKGVLAEYEMLLDQRDYHLLAEALERGVKNYEDLINGRER